MRRYIHALTAILLLFTTLTPARPAYKQVPQDLDHDGENDWAEVTVTHAEIHDRPIHQITHTKNWPFYTLEIRMKDGKKYMDQSSSLTSHCKW